LWVIPEFGKGILAGIDKNQGSIFFVDAYSIDIPLFLAFNRPIS
jgi:hypothetical protein